MKTKNKTLFTKIRIGFLVSASVAVAAACFSIAAISIKNNFSSTDSPTISQQQPSLLPQQPQQPQPVVQEIVEPTGKVVLNNNSYAKLISQQIPKLKILIPSTINLDSLTTDQINEYINERISLNLDDVVDNINQWNKERGIKEVIDKQSISFEKNNSKPVLYSAEQKPSLDVNLKYNNSESVQTKIVIENSNSITGTNHATDNEVLSTIAKYFKNIDINGRPLKKNLSLEPRLTNEDINFFIKSKLDINNIIYLAQQDLISQGLENKIDPTLLSFSFKEEGSAKVRIYVKYNTSNKLRTEITVSSIFYNDQQYVNNIKLPRKPEPLQQVDVSLSTDPFYRNYTWLDATNCGTIDGMYPIEFVLSVSEKFKKEKNLRIWYTFEDRNISKTFNSFEDENCYFFKPEVNIDKTGLFSLQAVNGYVSHTNSILLIDNPFYRTRMLVSNSGQFTINNDEITIKADIKTTNTEVYNGLSVWRPYVEIDDKTVELFWWDVTENRIVSNDTSFKVNKYDITQTHEYKLIITAKGCRVNFDKNTLYNWQDISYVSPESIFIRPFDPQFPYGQDDVFTQDFSLSSHISVNNNGYLNGFEPTRIKINPINFSKNYKLNWFRNGLRIPEYSNLSITDDKALEYIPTEIGKYYVEITDENGITLHQSKSIEIKENILKNISTISINKNSHEFKNWNDLLILQTNDLGIELPPNFSLVPQSYKVSIYDTISQKTFAKDLTAKKLYALKYQNNLNLKIKASATLYDKVNKQYIDISYEQPDSQAYFIKGYNGEFDLNKPTNPTEEDKKLIKCFRWAVMNNWPITDDWELSNMNVIDVTDRDLNSMYLLKEVLFQSLLAFYPEYEFKVNPANLVFKIVDRNLTDGSLTINIGYASDAINFAWSNIPVKIIGFDNDTDIEIANQIALNNQNPIAVTSEVPIDILLARQGYLHTQSVILNLENEKLRNIKKYNISFHTRQEDIKDAYDNYEQNVQRDGLPGAINVYVGYSGAISQIPIKVYGFRKGSMLRQYYYTAKENAEYFAQFNLNNPNLTVVRDIFSTNMINNELSINDVLVDNASWSANGDCCSGFYTDRLVKQYFGFVTTKEWRDEAMQTGKLKVRVKFNSPIDNTSALSDTVLTFKGFRSYKILHDNNQTHTDKELADSLMKKNYPGYKCGVIINEQQIHDLLDSYYFQQTIDYQTVTRELQNYIRNNKQLFENLVVNSMPKVIDRNNIYIQVYNICRSTAFEGANDYEFEALMKIGYKSPQNEEIMWGKDNYNSHSYVQLVFRKDARYNTFDIVKHKS